MPSLRALAVPVAALLAATACSLLAPSDADLMGETARSSTAGTGAEPAREGASGAGGSGGMPDADPDDAAPPAGGEAAAAPGGGGAGGSSDLPGLIPQDGLVLWLMADRGVAPPGSSQVALWADQSLNEADAWQSLDTLQPTVAQSEAEGPQMIAFDGASHQLALPQGFADFSAGLSVFIIASQSADVECPSLLHLSNGPELEDIEIGRDRGTIHYEVGNHDAWGTENAFVLNQRVLLGVVHAPKTAPELRLNGVFMASGNFSELPPVAARENNFIGRSLYSECQLFPGEIGEIIVYARAVDGAERDAIQRYLQSKWSYEPKIKSKPGPGEIEGAE